MKFVILFSIFYVAGAWSLSIKSLITFTDDSNWDEVVELLDSVKTAQSKAKDVSMSQLGNTRAEIIIFAYNQNNKVRLQIEEETSILSKQLNELDTSVGHNAKKLQCTKGLRDTITGVISTVQNYTLDCIDESVTECVQTIDKIRSKIMETDVRIYELDIVTNKCKNSILYPDCLVEIKGELITAYVEIPSTILEDGLRGLTLVNTWTTSITACISIHSGQITTFAEPLISDARKCISNAN